MKRILLAILFVLTALTVPATPALAIGGGAVAGDTAAPGEAPMIQTTTNSTADGNSSAPSTASQTRLTPVNFDEEFLGITVREPDQAYDTAGPFAVFTASHDVESVRVVESPATASVLDGGRQVKIAYDDDAAPSEEPSLYTLELFFADGSKKTIELYATETDVSVDAARLSEYASVIDDLEAFAEEHGYETTPEGLQNYLSFINDRADLIDGFLTDRAMQLIAITIALAQNPLAWLIGFGLLALLMKWLVSRYGDMLESLQNDVGRAERKRRELDLAYQESKQTADEHTLDEVPAVGANAIYWDDAFGTRSPAQLAKLAANGAHVRDGGELRLVHNGVDDLNPATLQNSWLEPVIRENRIPTAKQALGELKATLEWMETKHNLGHLYRDTRDELEQMIDEIDREQRSYQPSSADTADRSVGAD